mgnify:CR=1 FL=1
MRIKTSNLKNMESFQAPQKIKINEITVDLKNNANLFNVLKGTNTLVKDGVCKFENEEQTANRAALSFLFAIGCAPSGESIDFSLINTQTDTEALLNTNILNNLTYDRKKSNIEIDDKFPNKIDPIYELDNPLPIKVQTYIEQVKELIYSPNVERIASNFVRYNYNTSKTKLKYFK